jgi:16S rRNA (uracil1498-N3)-methyltransferase
VTAVDSLGAAIATLPAVAPGVARFALDPTSTERLSLPMPALHVTTASGPEGGLTPAELDALYATGFAPLSLGPRTLRAETAPLVAVALVRAATAT